MKSFLLMIFVIYGGVHLYLFLRLKNLFRFGLTATLMVSLCMAVMVLSPILVRFFEREGWAWGARLSAHVGYTWMGFVFVTFLLCLLGDLLSLALLTAKAAGLQGLYISPRPLTALALVLGLIICLYGVYEAWDIQTSVLTIETPRIPRHVGLLRIVQISDVHLGVMVRRERLSMILEKVKAASPDILVSTGDLVDGEMDSLEELSDLFREIKPRYGKFAVTGNHEFYAGIDQATAFTEKAGFRLLRGQSVKVAESITIAGVDDPAGRRFGGNRAPPEHDLLMKSEGYRILLKHQPRVIDSGGDGFDLQLSGHTHKGQIVPFNWITGLVYPYLAGRYDLGKGRLLYVCRGSGTWGPPMRVLAPPEIVVVDLVPVGDES